MKYEGTPAQLTHTLKVMNYVVISIQPMYHFISTTEIGTRFTIIAPGGSKLTIKFYHGKHTLMVQGNDRKAKDEFRRTYTKKVMRPLINTQKVVK